MRRQGVSYQSMLKYRQSDWLRSLGNGAFCESGDLPSIEAALAALVEQLELPLHLGGKTAVVQMRVRITHKFIQRLIFLRMKFH